MNARIRLSAVTLFLGISLSAHGAQKSPWESLLDDVNSYTRFTQTTQQQGCPPEVMLAYASMFPDYEGPAMGNPVQVELATLEQGLMKRAGQIIDYRLGLERGRRFEWGFRVPYGISQKNSQLETDDVLTRETETHLLSGPGKLAIAIRSSSVTRFQFTYNARSGTFSYDRNGFGGKPIHCDYTKAK